MYTHKSANYIITVASTILLITIVMFVESIPSVGTFLKNIQGTVSLKLTALIGLGIIIFETILGILLALRESNTEDKN